VSISRHFGATTLAIVDSIIESTFASANINNIYNFQIMFQENNLYCKNPKKNL